MTPPTQPNDRSATSPAECVYVYGIVDAVIHPSLLVGAARGAALEITGVGRVAAVYSWISPGDLQDIEPEIAEGSRLAKLVRTHDEVITALALAGPVLPVRLGTLLPDAERLNKLLEDAEESIVAALERVRGRAEWDLRVTVPAQSGADSPVASVPTPDAHEQTGTDYLLGRRAARQRAAELRSDIHSAIAQLDEYLARFADNRSSTGTAGTTKTVASAYLVRQELQADFVAAAREGVVELERLGCDATVRGPLPAYSFADVRLGGIGQ